jgi:hypothetical protein
VEKALVLVIYFLPGFSSLLVVLWWEDHSRDSEHCGHYLILGRYILYCGLQDLSASSFGNGIDVFRTLKLCSEINAISCPNMSIYALVLFSSLFENATPSIP